MNKIGLSNETLEQPDAKVNQVVAFLEALYDEDIEVKRQYTRDTGWVSNAPTIEDYALRTYLTIRALASEAEPNCIIFDSSLQAILQDITSAEQAFFQDKRLETAQQFRAALLSGQSVFATFEAHKPDGKPFSELVTLCRSNYQELADTDLEMLTEQVRELEDQREPV